MPQAFIYKLERLLEQKRKAESVLPVASPKT